MASSQNSKCATKTGNENVCSQGCPGTTKCNMGTVNKARPMLAGITEGYCTVSGLGERNAQQSTTVWERSLPRYKVGFHPSLLQLPLPFPCCVSCTLRSIVPHITGPPQPTCTLSTATRPGTKCATAAGDWLICSQGCPGTCHSVRRVDKPPNHCNRLQPPLLSALQSSEPICHFVTTTQEPASATMQPSGAMMAGAR